MFATFKNPNTISSEDKQKFDAFCKSIGSNECDIKELVKHIDNMHYPKTVTFDGMTLTPVPDHKLLYRIMGEIKWNAYIVIPKATLKSYYDIILTTEVSDRIFEHLYHIEGKQIVADIFDALYPYTPIIV